MSNLRLSYLQKVGRGIFVQAIPHQKKWAGYSRGGCIPPGFTPVEFTDAQRTHQTILRSIPVLALKVPIGITSGLEQCAQMDSKTHSSV